MLVISHCDYWSLVTVTISDGYSWVIILNDVYFAL